MLNKNIQNFGIHVAAMHTLQIIEIKWGTVQLFYILYLKISVHVYLHTLLWNLDQKKL